MALHVARGLNIQITLNFLRLVVDGIFLPFYNDNVKHDDDAIKYNSYNNNAHNTFVAIGIVLCDMREHLFLLTPHQQRTLHVRY